MSKKIAIISGATGQDASYLAEILLEKNYEVHGTIRRSSSFNTGRIDHIFDPDDKTYIHYADLADSSIVSLIYKIKPDEIYNLASMSHVSVSFKIPEYTGDITGLGVLRLLEGIRVGIENKIISPKTKFYQASSSEMYGITPPPQDENTLFQPVSPYGCAKLYGYHITRTYRRGYNMFACNGILFNHESERRGERFVTRKITRAVTRIKLGLQKKLILGNLDALRDWGHSRCYMRAVWLIMQHNIADDFVVSTGEYYSVKQFVIKAFEYVGLDPWKYVVFSDNYLRPCEVPALLGNSDKIRKTLGWKPEIDFNKLTELMIDSDMKLAEKELREKNL